VILEVNHTKVFYFQPMFACFSDRSHLHSN